MSYLSAGPSLRGLGPGARSLLVGASAALSSLAAGVAVASFGWIAAAVGAGLAGLWAVAFAPSFLVLGGVLVVRGLTDATAEVDIIAGLNGGALIGILLIVGAVLLSARRLAAGSVAGATVGTVFIAGLGYWTAVGVVQYGVDPSLVREFVRAASVLAVAVIAANADRTLGARRIADIVVVAALIPAVLVLGEGVAQWQEIAGGDLRPSGPLSHANAAAILFGAAIPMAAWRWAYGGGGQRYLLAAVALTAAILLTRSIGGLAQVVVSLFVATLLLPGRGRERALLGMGTGVIVALFVFDPIGLSRFSEIDPGGLTSGELDPHDNSFEWRLVNWGELLVEWREQPWLGHGLGATSERVRPLGHLPHSDPVRFLVEGGVLGAGLLAAGYVLLLSRLRGRARGAGGSFAAAVLAMLVGVSVHALATHVSFNTQPMYVIAALVGWTLGRPQGPERTPGRSASGATASYTSTMRRP